MSLNYRFNSPGGDGHGAGSSSLTCLRSLNYRRFNLLPGGDGHGAGDVAAPGSLRDGRRGARSLRRQQSRGAAPRQPCASPWLQQRPAAQLKVKEATERWR